MFSKSFMKRVTWLLLALSLILALTPAPAAQAAAIHYARSNGVTTGDCSSWATACTLTYALTQAVGGDQIWVAQGIYRPANTFNINQVITLVGGFPASGTPTLSDRNLTLYPTVLSGDLAGNDVTNGAGVVVDWTNIVGTDNSEMVVNLSASATLDGFIITGGRGGGSSGIGAGLFTTAATPALRNMVFQGNRSDSAGGAICFWENSGPVTVQDTRFIGNAALQGGAVAIRMARVNFTRVLFQDNDAVLDQWSGRIL